MTSTDLALALAVPLDTPGCWGCSRCKGDNFLHDCEYCNIEGEQPLGCLWPLPDSGDPGAELWCYWLMVGMGWGFTFEIESGERTTVYGEAGTEYVGSTFPAALYAAWQEQEKAQ